MRRILLSTACLPLLTAFALAGCTQDPGNLEIPFSIGASSVTCENAEVANVEMVLTEISEEGGGEIVEYTEIAPCTDGSVTFSGVAANSYNLEARALTSEELTVFDNFDPDSIQTIEALAGQNVTTDSVRLTPSPARVLVRWNLNKGGAQVQCAGVATKQFQISVFDTAGLKDLLIADPIACDAEAAESPWHVVADPDRKLDGDQVGLIDVTPQDAQGNPVGSPTSVVLPDPPGRGVSVKVIIDCDDDECTASLDNT
ncbi:MAG TPA: hypothetical protein ENJ18_02950 [Nannocystis exedens]|nr:hypothetical protein [Nannocystis exedens]